VNGGNDAIIYGCIIFHPRNGEPRSYQEFRNQMTVEKEKIFWATDCCDLAASPEMIVGKGSHLIFSDLE
jgi:hypothetical protein